MMSARRLASGLTVAFFSLAACTGAPTAEDSLSGPSAGAAGVGGDGGAAGDEGGAGEGDAGAAGEGGAGGEAGAGDAGSGGQAVAGAAGAAGAGPVVAPTPPDTKLGTWTGKLSGGSAIVVTYPDEGGGKTYPLVVFAHGFQLGVGDYKTTLDHIAKFGYVVASVDYASNLLDQDHHAPVDSMKQAITLLTTAPPAPIGSIVDPSRIASMGHSLGAKGAIWAALEMPEIKAVVALDPVDDGGSALVPANPTKRPSLAPEQMGKMLVPAFYLGAQLSPTGLMACAPKGSNACGFAAAMPAGVPVFHQTIEQFGHMQFLDNPSCLACIACAKGSGANDAAGRALTRSLAAAFLEVVLGGKTEETPLLEGPFIDQARAENLLLDATEEAAFCAP